MVNQIKKAQVTLFIILGIIIVVAILMSLLFMGKTKVEPPSNLSPREFIQDCVKDSLRPYIKTVTENGGRINPGHYILYYGEKYNYLCFNSDYYLPCYNTHPMLEMITEQEIRQASKDDIQECFDKLKYDYESKGYEVTGGSTEYSIDILPGEIKVILNKDMTIKREGSSSNFNNFETKIISPLYDLIRISREIVNSESQFCAMEYLGYMILYPNYDIKRIDYDTSKLYMVKDRKTGEEFKFAIRSCAMAPGI